MTFTKGLSSHLISRGIRVNAIAPGPVWTPLVVASFPDEMVSLSFCFMASPTMPEPYTLPHLELFLVLTTLNVLAVVSAGLKMCHWWCACMSHGSAPDSHPRECSTIYTHETIAVSNCSFITQSVMILEAVSISPLHANSCSALMLCKALFWKCPWVPMHSHCYHCTLDNMACAPACPRPPLPLPLLLRNHATDASVLYYSTCSHNGHAHKLKL